MVRHNAHAPHSQRTGRTINLPGEFPLMPFGTGREPLTSSVSHHPAAVLAVLGTAAPPLRLTPVSIQDDACNPPLLHSIKPLKPDVQFPRIRLSSCAGKSSNRAPWRSVSLATRPPQGLRRCCFLVRRARLADPLRGARQIPRGPAHLAERTAAFKQVRQSMGFTESAVSRYATTIHHARPGNDVDAVLGQTLAH